MMPHWPDQVWFIRSTEDMSNLDLKATGGNRQCVIDVRLRQLEKLVAGILGYISVGLINWDIQLGPKSLQQGLPHDAHKCGIPGRPPAALTELRHIDGTRMMLCVAQVANGNQVIRSIAAGAPAL